MEELSFPYRRFSSDAFAMSLIDLLDQNGIPFEVIAEPEGMGSVILGSAAIPGVIVMVRPADATRIQQLEKKDQPIMEQVTAIVAEEVPDSLHPLWIIGGYLMVLVGSPISLILGLHFMTATRRRKDFSYQPAYSETVRTHGKIIFALSLLFLLYGIVRLIIEGPSGNLLGAISLLFDLLRTR